MNDESLALLAFASLIMVGYFVGLGVAISKDKKDDSINRDHWSFIGAGIVVAIGGIFYLWLSSTCC